MSGGIADDIVAASLPFSSSRRFKDEIKPIDNASEAILALKPVTFHDKQEIDPRACRSLASWPRKWKKIRAPWPSSKRQGSPTSSAATRPFQPSCKTTRSLFPRLHQPRPPRLHQARAPRQLQRQQLRLRQRRPQQLRPRQRRPQHLRRRKRLRQLQRLRLNAASNSDWQRVSAG